MSVFYTEVNKSSKERVVYPEEGSKGSRITGGSGSGSGTGLSFKKIFLPEGFPDSVSGDYVDYQIWDTVQAFASSISGSLATKAVLEGVGVGDDAATPLAATITWLMVCRPYYRGFRK